MSKSKEELNALKEVEIVNEKLQELTPEELKQVTGGTEQELRFAIREGGRTVGAGKMTDII